MPEKIPFNTGTLGVTNIGARFRRINQIKTGSHVAEQRITEWNWILANRYAALDLFS